MVLLRFIEQLVRDRLYDDLCAVLAFIIIRLHLKKIDEAFILTLSPDRDLKADRVLAEAGSDLIDRAEEIRTDDVHLIDKCHTRYVILVSLSPNVLRLRLNAALCVKDADCAVKDSQ